MSDVEEKPSKKIKMQESSSIQNSSSDKNNDSFCDDNSIEEDVDEFEYKEEIPPNGIDIQTEYEIIKQNGFYLNYECDTSNIFTPSSSHTILFDYKSLNYQDHQGPPLPLPLGEDKWDDDHVKMPFSNQNLNENKMSLWKEITRRLKSLAETLAEDPDPIHIEYTIKSINMKYKLEWNFGALHYLFNDELEGRKGEKILQELFPKIIKLALDLPNKVTQPIPILKQGTTQSVSLTQEQCACLLANAFFCTFPDRYGSKYSNKKLPFINFNNLFNHSKYDKKSIQRKVEKIKCLLHYFQRVSEKMPCGVVTFTRQFLNENDVPDFKNSKKTFRKAIVMNDGTIEDCIGTLQLDFANKYLGGGVLNSGCVQEEIRFVICPELIVSMLFIESMLSNESVVIRGCERFSSYKGYGDSFKWGDDYADDVARDSFKRLYTDILAIDALCFRYPKMQFNESKVIRELIKCYSGFKTDGEKNNLPAISTGNWGCGVYRGDRQLKFLIQMMAAAEAERDLIYFTFNDSETKENLNGLIKLLEENKMTVGQVYDLVNDYADEIRDLKSIGKFGLRQYMETIFKSI